MERKGRRAGVGQKRGRKRRKNKKEKRREEKIKKRREERERGRPNQSERTREQLRERLQYGWRLVSEVSLMFSFAAPVLPPASIAVFFLRPLLL